jgi:nicotinamidase-related amidase
MSAIPRSKSDNGMTAIDIECRAQRHFGCNSRNTALLVIDMQYDFVDTNGACGASGANVAQLKTVIPAIKTILETARNLGLLVIHTRYGFKPDLSDLSEAVRQQSRDAGGEYGTPGPMGRILTRGEAGHQIIDELAPLASEPVIDKSTFSAFTFTDLNERLRRGDVSHLWIVGVTTQCCVEGTIRDAVDRGYYVLTIEDACAAFERDLHDGTMRALQSEGHLFGWITETSKLVAACRRQL